MSGILELAAFFVGLLFGSFLNVCISRIPKGESIVKPRSRCPHCTTPIRWYDNIPILSWLLLRGRCRDCKTVIPWRYPLVELSVGIWFMTRRCQVGSLVDLAKDAIAHLSGSDFFSLGVAQVALAILA